MDIITLYRTHLQRLVGRGRRAYLRDPEDVAIKAYTNLFAAHKAGRMSMDEKSLFTIMTGLVRNELESGAHRLERATDPRALQELAERSPESTLVWKPLDQEGWLFLSSLLGALSEMKPRRAGAWLLREVHGWTYPEIGLALGVSKQRACVLCEEARVILTQEVYH